KMRLVVNSLFSMTFTKQDTVTSQSGSLSAISSGRCLRWQPMGIRFVLACVGLLVLPMLAMANPEPPGWYTGDLHVHRSCGGAPISVQTILDGMAVNDVSVVSLLADMGNGEVQDASTDLLLVNGQNDPHSTSNRIIRWDAEWHWDADYFEYPHQALGGHVVALGLTNAVQMFGEYTYPVFSWARQQGGYAGFAH